MKEKFTKELYSNLIGVGYRIYFNDVLIIDQPYTPGAQGFVGMTADEADAYANDVTIMAPVYIPPPIAPIIHHEKERLKREEEERAEREREEEERAPTPPATPITPPPAAPPIPERLRERPPSADRPLAEGDFFSYDPNLDVWGAQPYLGESRWKSTGLSIAGMGYLCCGRGGREGRDRFREDVLRYDPNLRAWTWVANFLGGGRESAVGFSIGLKGYVGLGETRKRKMNDLWEYNPSTNRWSRLADLPGSARNSAVGFSIGSKGYVGLGYLKFTSALSDFWEYDPSNNSWAQLTDFGGGRRAGSVGFSLGSKGYVGLGIYNNAAKRDFWEYDPSNNSWRQLSDFIGDARCYGIGLSTGSRIFVGLGATSTAVGRDLRELYEYLPSTDQWTRAADFIGDNLRYPVGFSIYDKVYIHVCRKTTNLNFIGKLFHWIFG
jgi:N-acetylneuraminic acid mutarotase